MSRSRLATLGFDAVGRATIVTVNGEVDMSNADELLGELAPRIGAEPWLVLDLSACGYLDSAGLGMIARLDVRSRDEGTGLRLVVPDRAAIDRALLMSGMHEMLIVDRSREEAIASALEEAPESPPPSGTESRGAGSVT